MKMQISVRGIWRLVLLFCLCLSGNPAFADDDNDFAPISECGTIISSPGHYKLVNDLIDCNVPNPFGGLDFSLAIGINSDRVVFDLDGHTISCGPAPSFPVGVYTEPLLSKVRIKNGTVTGCGLGVLLNQSNRSTVRDMTLLGNFNGIEVLAGSRNVVRGNVISRNWSTGVFLNSFIYSDAEPEFVGKGVDNRVFKNLIVDNGSFGIDANNVEDNSISCNRVDRNLITGVSVTEASKGNRVDRNVANNNQVDGIAFIGLEYDGFVFQPIPAGSDVNRNTALGNNSTDLVEGVFDVFDYSFRQDPDGLCRNNWGRNQYITEFAAAGCVPEPVILDTKNGCAPGTDNDDDGDENQLKDPGFEFQLPPEQGGWLLFNPSQSFFSEASARSGQRSLLHEGFGVNGSFQEIPAEPGSQWRLTGYGLTPMPLGPGAFGIVQFTFFDTFGIELGTVETQGAPFPALPSNPINERSPDNQWVFLDSGIGTAPEGTASITAFTLYLDFSGSVQQVYFDDLKLCALDDEFECIELDDDDADHDDDDD
jgi:parallel beta-helix repeat protein